MNHDILGEPMSEQNVKILRESMARFEQDGIPDLETFDPDVEIINFDAFPLTRPYHGWDGIRAWLTEVSEPFEDFQFHVIEVLAHNDEHVVTECRVKGQSKTGGPPFELTWGVVWTFRDGKVTRAEGLRTPDEALKAAGFARNSA